MMHIRAVFDTYTLNDITVKRESQSQTGCYQEDDDSYDSPTEASLQCFDDVGRNRCTTGSDDPYFTAQQPSDLQIQSDFLL